MGLKHGRTDDYDDLYVGIPNQLKRVKLDALFDGLRLDDLSKDSKYVINPQVNTFAFNEDTTEDINFYIRDKLYKEFNEHLESKYCLIKLYNHQVLVIDNFKKWSVRMFNLFLKKYNLQNTLKIPRITNFDKLLRITKGKLSLIQLFDIIILENQIVLWNLNKKLEKRKDKEYQENVKLLSTLQYTYWDNLKLDPDFEMGEDYGDDEIIEPDEEDMDIG